MSYKTNRQTRGIFKLRNATQGTPTLPVEGGSTYWQSHYVNEDPIEAINEILRATEKYIGYSDRSELEFSDPETGEIVQDIDSDSPRVSYDWSVTLSDGQGTPWYLSGSVNPYGKIRWRAGAELTPDFQKHE